MTKNTDNTETGATIIQLTKREKRRAEDKFGIPVMKHGYTMLPNLLMQAQGRLKIGHAEFNVLVQLISHWWEADKDPAGKHRLRMRMISAPLYRSCKPLNQSSAKRRSKRGSARKRWKESLHSFAM